MEFIEFKHQAIMHIHSLLSTETSHYCIVYIYFGSLRSCFRPEIEASICVSNLKLSNLVKFHHKSRKSLVTWSILGWKRMLLTWRHFFWWHERQSAVSGELNLIVQGAARLLSGFQDARNNRRVEFLCVCALNGIEMRAYDESII